MHILMLSLDQALVQGKGEGETLSRFQAYASRCQTFTAVVPTIQKASIQRLRNITIIPAYGRFRWFAYVNLWGKLWHHLHTQLCDVVVCNDAILGAMALVARPSKCTSVQVNIFGLEIIDPHWLAERPQNYLLKWIQEWAIQRVDHLRTDNHKEKSLLISHYHISKKRIQVIPIAPSQKTQERFVKAKPNLVLRKRWQSPEKKILLSVGGLVPAKGFEYLVEAAYALKKKRNDFVWLIAGEGDQRSKLETQIAALKLKQHVILLGSISHHDLPRYFASCDLFALTSTHEGLPRVLMEAALAGKPVVATAIDGVKDLITDSQSGRIVAVADAMALAAATDELLSSPSKSKLYGQALQKHAVWYLNFDKAVDQLIHSWQALVAT